MSATMRLPDSSCSTARRGGPSLTSSFCDGLAEAELHVALSHLVNQLVDDLGVDELERSVALVDDRHLDAERREHRRVFDADDAGADHGERSREALAAGRCRRS